MYEESIPETNGEQRRVLDSSRVSLLSWFLLSSHPARYAAQSALQSTFKHVPVAYAGRLWRAMYNNGTREDGDRRYKDRKSVV